MAKWKPKWARSHLTPDEAKALADFSRRLDREEEEAARLQDQDPGRFPEWASPARMRRERERDRLEDEDRR